MHLFPAQYEYYVRLGSGSTAITLAVVDERAIAIEVIRLWMGQDKQVYRLFGLYQSINAVQGFMRITQIDQEGIGTIYTEPPIDYGDDLYGLHIPDVQALATEIVFEYVLFSQPLWHFSGDRVLDAIRVTTGAEWNDTFTLLLFTLPLTKLPPQDAVKYLIAQLNHTKFRQIGDLRLPDE